MFATPDECCSTYSQYYPKARSKYTSIDDVESARVRLSVVPIVIIITVIVVVIVVAVVGCVLIAVLSCTKSIHSRILPDHLSTDMIPQRTTRDYQGVAKY